MPTFWVYPQPPIADPPELKKLTVCDRCFITGPWIVVSPNQFAPAFPPFPTLKNLVDDFQKNQQSRIDTFVNEAWEKAKKSDLAAIAERELSGSGWLPDMLKAAA